MFGKYVFSEEKLKELFLMMKSVSKKYLNLERYKELYTSYKAKYESLFNENKELKSDLQEKTLKLNDSSYNLITLRQDYKKLARRTELFERFITKTLGKDPDFIIKNKLELEKREKLKKNTLKK